MGHLEHVDRAAQVLREAARDELRIDLLFHVSGEEHSPLPEAKVEHDRLVVDLLAVVARPGRYGPGWRPVHVQLDAVEPQPVARRDCLRRAALLGEHAPICSVARATPDHARLDDLPNAIALEEQGQPAHVVLVRMGQHDHVKAPVPGRDARVETGQLEVRVRPGVDQHPAAGGSLEQD